MKKIIFSLVLLAFASHMYAQKRPNIIIILSDDAGYADFSFQSKRLVPTPNIDRIANEGVKFTSGYMSGAVCAPSRAGLLTGINQAEFGNSGNYIRGVKYNIDKSEYGIPKNIPLLGNYLKPLGYTTGMIGKWHEGFSNDFQPWNRGFDYFWGFLWGSSRYKAGSASEVVENGTPVPPKSIPYMTDAISDHAIDFIQKEKNKPFFLYVAYNAVHTPQEAKIDDIENFRKQFPDNKKRMMNAAMTHELDEGVGRILKKLEDMELLDNTLIFFANDNGGQTKTLAADNYPLRGMKGDIWDGGIRVAMSMRWPGKIAPGTVCNTPVRSLDFLPTMIDAAGGNAKKYDSIKGVDIMNVLSHPKKYYNRTLTWYAGYGNGAIRKGDWKLDVIEGQKPALYNITKDIEENRDQSKIKSKKYKDLLTEYSKWKESLPPARYYSLKNKNKNSDD